MRKEPRLPPPMATVGGRLWDLEEREQRELPFAKFNFLSSDCLTC